MSIAANLAIAPVEALAKLKGGQIPSEALFWAAVAPFEAPVAPIRHHLPRFLHGGCKRDACNTMLSGLAELYVGRNLSRALECMEQSVSLAGTAEERLALLTVLARTSLLHDQVSVAQKTMVKARYLARQLDAYPLGLMLIEAGAHRASGNVDRAQAALVPYEEGLYGRHKDPFGRSKIERELAHIEAGAAYMANTEEARRKHLLRASDQFRKAFNLQILSGLPRWSDPTWALADATWSCVDFRFYENASAPWTRMSTGADAFLEAPYLFNLNAALVDLLLGIQADEDDALNETERRCDQLIESISSVEGDSSWAAVISEPRALANSVAGLIARRKDNIAEAIALFKQVFAESKDGRVRLRALRLIHQTLASGPVLSDAAPAIEMFAQEFGANTSPTDRGVCLVTEEDRLWN